jgi:hypothetical protein
VTLASAIAEATARNEAALAATVQPYAIDAGAQSAIAEWRRWCGDNGVRPCPAHPAAVAVWVRSMGALGLSEEKIAAALTAVGELHDARGLANPCATAPVRSELTRMLELRAPRSWRRAEQLMFSELPAEIRLAVERRERQRDTELRRLQAKVHQLTQKELKP